MIDPSALLGQAQPFTPCATIGLAGCGGPSNVIAESVLPQIALFFLRVAGGLSLVFIILAGIQMMIAWGDDSKISTQKKAIVNAMIGLVLAVLSQAFVSAVATYDYSIGNANDAVVGGVLVYVVDIMLSLVNVVFVIMVILIGIRMVMSQGKTDEFNAGRRGLLWAISGAVIINISHTLVRVVLTQFGV